MMRRHQLTPYIHPLEVVEKCISKWEITVFALENSFANTSIGSIEKIKQSDRIKSGYALLSFWQGYKEKHYSQNPISE